MQACSKETIETIEVRDRQAAQRQPLSAFVCWLQSVLKNANVSKVRIGASAHREREHSLPFCLSHQRPRLAGCEVRLLTQVRTDAVEKLGYKEHTKHSTLYFDKAVGPASGTPGDAVDKAQADSEWERACSVRALWHEALRSVGLFVNPGLLRVFAQHGSMGSDATWS